MFAWMASLAFAGVLAIAVAVPMYALPAMLTLPRGRRPGLEPLSLAQAADRLRSSGKSGMAQVEAARGLIGVRMVYCRRNSYEPYDKAFARGYGYCQQQAYALADLLGRLGFEAKVVSAFRNRFPDGLVTGHAWVRVMVDGEMRDVDPLHYDVAAGDIDFTPITPVRDYSPAFRLLAGWGSAAVNAHRYYVTGKDTGR